MKTTLGSEKSVITLYMNFEDADYYNTGNSAITPW